MPQIKGPKKKFFKFFSCFFKKGVYLQSQNGNGLLAQLVEHDTLNVGVQGSSP
jgi:hypothetical protein